MFRDLQYAWRILLKSPAFTAIAVATLALGIGANTAIFSVANALLLRALPYPHPDRLVLISGGDFAREGSYGRLSYPFFRLIRGHSRSYSAVAACTFENFTLTGRGEAQQILSARVAANFFDLLGVSRGRPHLPARGRPVAGGRRDVVLISYEFGPACSANPNAALGQTLPSIQRRLHHHRSPAAGLQLRVVRPAPRVLGRAAF